MKTLLILLLATGLSVAQTLPDSLKNKEMNREQIKIQMQQKELNNIKEKIGSKENPENDKNNNRPKMDVFIDRDGDGICDNRQSGMSFNKMRNRKSSGGQRGPGGPHNSGGGSQMQNGYHGGR